MTGSQDEVTLLDGGVGQEIVKRAGERPTPLWSTAVMLEHPEIVRAVHEDYFRAGADIATANTYAVHRDRLAPEGLEDRFEALLDAALDAAEAARDAVGRGRVAGSIGPLRASYRPDLLPPLDEAVAAFAEVAAHLARRADLLIAETVASLDHARAVLRGAAGHGRPVWLALTVDDDDGTRLRSGEPLAAVAEVLAAEPAPEAVLLNCSRPEAIDRGLEVIAGFGLPFGAYANGFTRITEGFLEDRPTVEALEARRDLTPEAYADFAMGWIGRGARIVGGCCETTPAHIAEIARRLGREGREQA